MSEENIGSLRHDMVRCVFLKDDLGHCVENKRKESKGRNKMRQGNYAIIQARDDGDLRKSSDYGSIENS